MNNGTDPAAAPAPADGSGSGGDHDHIPSSCSMDSLFEEMFRDTHACTHTHTCNPPGPDLTHTHTCFHVHTKILTAGAADETAESTEKSVVGKKRPCGNREAVRKYREKKKARAASLEDENRELRAENQQLHKRLNSLGAVEAENMRLKCLLVDLRGRIDGEIGSFPYQRTNHPCNMRCQDQLYCGNPPTQVDGAVDGMLDMQGFGGACEFGADPCLGNSADEVKGFLGCGHGNGLPATCASIATERKGAYSAANS